MYLMNHLFCSQCGFFKIPLAISVGILLVTKVNATPMSEDAISSEITLSEEFESLNSPILEEERKRDLLAAPEISQGVAENLSGVEITTPLQKRHPRFPTAEHLEQGAVTFQIYNRQFFDPSESDATQAYPSLGVSWGLSDQTELTFTYHRLDTGGLARQGKFRATRNSKTDNPFLDSQEVTLEVKQRLWQNESETEAISAVLSASVGDRGFRFVGGGRVEEGLRQGVVPAIQIPYTNTSSDERFQFTLAPTIAFFDQENALHLHQTPSNDPDEFGSTLGVSGTVSYLVNSRLMLWGDVFAPFTGNNSISRETGEAGKTIIYNAGLRYMANPRVAVDVFASNSLGHTGALTLTGDRELVALGAGVEFFPNFIGASHRYPETFGDPEEATELAEAGFAFYDGGILNSGQFMVNLRGGSQGILSSLRFSPARDLEVGIYLDSVSGTIDESEQGISGKIRLLDQAKGDPLTGSFAATVGITNEAFVNFDNNNRGEFEARNLSKKTPFVLEVDSRDEGKLFIATLALPLHYRFNNGSSAWVTPTIAHVQRNGIQIAGLNLGGALPLNEEINLIGEVGANFAGEGNAFVVDDGEKRGNALAYTVGLRWQPKQLLGMSFEASNYSPELEFYLTNRVGSSTFHNLRVRDQKNIAVGFGLSIPFR